MSTIASLIAGLLGLIALALAGYYYLTPAGGLPAFLPGFEAGSDHIHTSHALGCLVVGLVLLAAAVFAWVQRPSEPY